MPAETILNRKALRDFHILERFEAGIELKGSEVKSIRAGKANINDAFARIDRAREQVARLDYPFSPPRARGSRCVRATAATRQRLVFTRARAG